MSEKQDMLTPDELAREASACFSRPVEKITAPGGKSRDSVRVHFDGFSVIATQRRFPGRMRLEIEVLKRLTRVGAPVPRLLGQTERVFFQQDIGRDRLSGRLFNAGDISPEDVVARAFESLVKLQQAGKEARLQGLVPALGVTQTWVRGLVSTPLAASESYGISPPHLDDSALIRRLVVPAQTFIKWDARPGNAAIGGDGRVIWFDWEHCGRRQGMEDFAWLAGDEFFPLESASVIPVLHDLLVPEDRDENLDYLTYFITFHIVQRLTIIYRQFASDGWDDPDEAIRYDNIGVDPDLAIALCQRGAGWADRRALTRPLAPWFLEIAKAIEGLRS